jgi:hypothetical protein
MVRHYLYGDPTHAGASVSETKPHMIGTGKKHGGSADRDGQPDARDPEQLAAARRGRALTRHIRGSK